MKTLLLALALVAAPARAGTVDLSYGGRLTDATGRPVDGPVDLEVAFFDAASGGTALGPAPIQLPGTALSDGVFQAPLALSAADAHVLFGAAGGPVWVEVRDKTHGKTYPRQHFSFVPYALKVPVDGSTIGYNGNGELTFTGSTGVASVGATAPLSTSGPATAPVLSLSQATGTTNGYLSSADWTTFNGKQAALGFTPVNKAGDTMTGALSVLTPTAASDAVTKAYADGKLGGFALDQASKLDQYVVKWDNTAGKYVLGADQLGAAGGGIQSINALNATAQTLAVGTAGTAPAWTSATSTHTLDIPMASAAGVTAGLLAKTDYDAFTAKQAVITAASTVNTGTLTTALQNGVDVKPYGVAAGNTGELRFDELAANGANYVGFKAPDVLAANKIWTLPAADGTTGQVLKTDGAGNLSWVAQPTVNGQSGTVTLTTTNVAEGTGLYYTDARARAALSGTGPVSYNTGTGAIGLTISGTAPVSYNTGTGAIGIDVGTGAAQVAAGNHTHANATTATAGLLSGADKLSLDGLVTNAVVDGDFGANGLMRRTAAGTYDTITDGSTNWTTGYNERRQWDGSSTNLVAATGRTSLGLGTAATLNSGTGVGDVVTVQTGGKLPALDGSSLTALSPAALGTGTIATARLPVIPTSLGGFGADVSAATGVPKFTAGALTYLTPGTGASNLVQLDGSSRLPGVDASALTALNASALASGTVADGRLSANVSLFGAAVDSSEITDGTITAADVNGTQVATATTAIATYYVDPAGNDANACTATGASACKTINGAIAKLPRYILHDTTISVLPGSYTEDVSLNGFLVTNNATLKLQGNGGVFTVTNSTAYGIRIASRATRGAIRLKDAASTGAASTGIYLTEADNVYLENVTANSAGGDGILIIKSRAYIDGNVTANSNGANGLEIDMHSYVSATAGTLTTNTNAATGTYVQRGSFFYKSGGAHTSLTNSSRGMSVALNSYYSNSVGSIDFNDNVADGLSVTSASQVDITWTTGGTGINFGYGTLENGTGGSTAVSVANMSRMQVIGDATKFVNIKSLKSTGLIVSNSSFFRGDYVNANSNGLTGTSAHGVSCAMGSVCYFNNVNADSNHDNGFYATNGSMIYANGPVSADNNGTYGVYALSQARITLAGTTCTANGNAMGLIAANFSIIYQACNMTANSNSSYGILVDDGSSYVQDGTITTASNTTYAVYVRETSTYVQKNDCVSCTGASYASTMARVRRKATNGLPAFTVVTQAEVNSY